ncbi:hypothetical protein J0H33_08150, partial [bacterium]|nr:hypothetical protein [bacterium]
MSLLSGLYRDGQIAATEDASPGALRGRNQWLQSMDAVYAGAGRPSAVLSADGDHGIAVVFAMREREPRDDPGGFEHSGNYDGAGDRCTP